MWLKNKVDKGAKYIVTQMFFDNSKYFAFVERCRNAGITIPIIPGVKPITNLTQLSLLPKVFHVDLPTELATELIKCQDDAAAKQVGVEWCLNQSRELLAHGVENIHYYSLMATASVKQVVKELF